MLPKGKSPGGGGKVFQEAKYGATAAAYGGCIGGGGGAVSGTGLESLDYLVGGVSRGLHSSNLAPPTQYYRVENPIPTFPLRTFLGTTFPPQEARGKEALL